MGARVAGIVAAAVILPGCSSPPPEPTSEPAPAVTTTAVPDEVVATAALGQIDGLRASWRPEVTTVTFRSGVLRVTLLDSSMADQVALAVKNSIRLGDDRVVKREVDWVEVVNPEGEHLAQEEM